MKICTVLIRTIMDNKALPGLSDEHELERSILQEILLMPAYPSSLLLLSEPYQGAKNQIFYNGQDQHLLKLSMQ